MKFCKSLLLSCIVLTLTLPLYATEGNEGGGGDQLIVEFISIGNELIREPILDDADKDLLGKTINTTKIVTVSILKNPVTGKDIPNQKTLVAWGSPNLIQLKLSSGLPGEAGWDKIDRRKESIAQYVFHELYRASGVMDSKGQSPDETFQISIGKYRLDKYFIDTTPVTECTLTNKILLESFVFKTTIQRFGQDARVKMASQMYSTNLYGRMACFYEILYSVSYRGSDGKMKDSLGNALFNYKFERPRYEVTLEATDL
ncbi:MAG: hypothetical protein H0V66_06190 [Bdellovibrionales bacterium]|nr:hypothetical protein [Bdellovibrionales bacterium]